jgi:hypothetical protein
MLDLIFPELPFDFLDGSFHFCFYGFNVLDLKDKMHPSLKIQSQVDFFVGPDIIERRHHPYKGSQDHSDA